MTSSTATAAPAPPRALRPRRGRAGWLVYVSIVIALGLLSPLVLVGLDARQAGWTEIHRVLFRARSQRLLLNTVELSIVVVTAAAVIGTAAAWCTERCALPLRRLWTVLLVLPIAVPDFVAGYAWHSIRPTFTGLWAAALVMTLSTYPLIYLPVAAALRRADPGVDEVARSLGLGRAATFLRVTVPQIRPALIGGALVVVLTLLSEYGAFEIVHFQTFTTEIFTEFQFDQAAASALSVPLVLLGLIVLTGESRIGRRGRVSRTASQAARMARRRRLGYATAPVLAALSALIALAVGVPIGTLIYWMQRSERSTLPAAATVGKATWATVDYSAWGALVAVALALPIAIMAVHRASTARRLIERSTYLTQSLPGVVIALSLVFFSIRYAYPLYQTSFLLVAAYAILHFPLALVCVKVSVVQAPPRLGDIGRSLGRGPAAVFARVTLPLIAPGLLAGFCLVFLTATTELTATLVLAPTGVHTLATQFWAYQSEAAYGAAAPYALVIIALAAVPSALLGLWFDRERYSRVAVLEPAT
ncbi:MAG TPA: iron ABC transporter permease [Acidothermaceae bacterium]|nr:iron ABC transporter permease [Acidothermaceae bacterium]